MQVADCLVSIIIPVFESEPYLRQCIESVLAQTYAEIEVVAVDDGSRDGSKHILLECASADKRLHVITLETNQGPGPARNRGMKAAHGRWICCIDSDDYVHPRYVERLVTAALEHRADLVLCSAVVVDPNNDTPIDEEHLTIHWPVRMDNTGFDSQNTSVKPYLLSINREAWCKLIDVDLAIRVGFPESVRRFEDRSFVFGVLLRAERMTFIREQLYYRRPHAGSITAKVIAGEDFVGTMKDFKEVDRLCRLEISGDPVLLSQYDPLYAALSARLSQMFARSDPGHSLSSSTGKTGRHCLNTFLKVLSLFAPYGLVKMMHSMRMGSQK